MGQGCMRDVIAVIPEIGAAYMSQTWIDDIRTWPAPVPEDDGVTLLAETLREVAGGTGCLGVPMGPETQVRMPPADITGPRVAARHGADVGARPDEWAG